MKRDQWPWPLGPLHFILTDSRLFWLLTWGKCDSKTGLYLRLLHSSITFTPLLINEASLLCLQFAGLSGFLRICGVFCPSGHVNVYYCSVSCFMYLKAIDITIVTVIIEVKAQQSILSTWKVFFYFWINNAKSLKRHQKDIIDTKLEM